MIRMFSLLAAASLPIMLADFAGAQDRRNVAAAGKPNCSFDGCFGPCLQRGGPPGAGANINGACARFCTNRIAVACSGGDAPATHGRW